VLAASVMLRHVTDDPVRAVTLAWRALPAPLRGLVVLAGPYGRAAALWGAGDRRGALTALEASPARLAAFSLAVDQPTVARSALARLSEHNGARPRLAARLAYREGRLTDAVEELDDAHGWRAARLRRSLLAELAMLEPGSLRLPERAGGPVSGPPSPEQPQSSNLSHSAGGRSGARVFAASSRGGDTGGRSPRHDRGLQGGRPPAGDRASSPRGKNSILHVVTDALPSTSAGYTIRTHEIALAQRAVGLDPHVTTRIGFPVTAGAIDGRATVTVDGVPYHRLLPWVMPGRMDRLYQTHLRHAARLTQRLKPAVLHAASNYANAVIALALREATGLPVVYEVRGFWEDTWLSRHATNADLKLSDRYVRTRALETHCMAESDLVVTLGEAMREEIIKRGVPAEKVIIVPNGVSEEFLRPLPDGAALKAGLGIKPDEYVVGLVSSLVAHEGIGTLLEAVKILNDQGVRTRALIVGDGPERTALQRQAAALGLDAIFTGRVPSAKVRDYHAVLDVFVVPRTPDRVCQLVTPLKPVEAMASGLPVVVSSVRALAEIVHDGETGLLFPPLDAAGLADRLGQLLGRPDLRAKLGSKARDWVARDRTWAHNAARYRAIYGSLRGDDPPAPPEHGGGFAPPLPPHGG
jgi:glycosyltransferase involved in cell wall biosynthesis